MRHGLVQTTEQADKADIAAEDEGTKYIGRCCRGGDSEQRYRVVRELLVSCVRVCVLQVASKDLVKKLQGSRSWFDTCKGGSLQPACRRGSLEYLCGFPEIEDALEIKSDPFSTMM